MNTMTLSQADQALHNVIESLSKLLQSENEALSERRLDVLAANADAKADLTNQYQQEIIAFRSDPARIGALRPEQRSHFQDMMEQMRQLIEVNARHVIRFKSIAEGIVKSIADEANRKNRTVDGYSARGNRATMSVAQNAYARPNALSINQTI